MQESRLNIIFIAIVSVLLGVGIQSKIQVIDGGTPYGCSTEEITDMYAEYVEKWKQEVKIAFNQAEEEILGKEPVPDVIGPDPDPDKCICGGSGWIKQGDGHKTKCPFHGEGIAGKHGLIIHEYKN